MTSRFAGMLAVIALAVGLTASAARAQQTHIEKIPVQHIDVRIVAALLGAPVLPNELELSQQRSLGGGLGSGYGYGGGSGYGYGASPYNGGFANNRLMGAYPSNGFTPGYASAYPQAANARSPWFAQGNAPVYAPRPGFVVDPNTNAVITGR